MTVDNFAKHWKEKTLAETRQLLLGGEHR